MFWAYLLHFIHNRIPFIKFKGWEKERLTLLRTNLYLLGFFAILGVILSLPSFDLSKDSKISTFIYSYPYHVCVYSDLVFYMQHQHDPNYKAWKEDWQYLLAAIKGSSYYKLPKFSTFYRKYWVSSHSSFGSKVPFYKLEKKMQQGESYFPKICDDYYVIKQYKICIFIHFGTKKITE